MAKLGDKIGVVAVCGKYRTGKSYLMNKLFLQHSEEKDRGFTVGPTVNACTKGLWIWREVFYKQDDEEKQMPIVVIDTEGLGAFDEEQNHDTKIFLLALLLCSLLIYNSVGPIDENAL
jgi:septin family protein